MLIPYLINFGFRIQLAEFFGIILCSFRNLISYFGSLERAND